MSLTAWGTVPNAKINHRTFVKFSSAWNPASERVYICAEVRIRITLAALQTGPG
jgi:hypothetical protein